MVEAKINKEYALRMAGVTLLMLGICLWSLYDGIVAWPRKNQEFAGVRPALLATNLSARAWLSRSGGEGRTELELLFSSYNLKPPARLIKKIDEAKSAASVPESLMAQARERERETLKKTFEGEVYDRQDLQGQFVMAALTALAAVIILFSFAGKISKCYVADDIALSGSGFDGRTINYADIESIDWKQWNKKGIVKISVTGGALYTLDGWHFAGITPVVDKIVGQRPDLAQESGGGAGASGAKCG